MKSKVLPILVLLVAVIFSGVCNAQSSKKLLKAGLEFVETGNYADALGQFTKAIELDPKYTEAYLERGKAYEELGENEKALEDYKRILTFEKENKQVYYYLGRVANKLKLYDDALGYLNTASHLNERDERIYPEKISSLIALGRYDRALQVSDTALLLRDSENPLNYYQRGILFDSLNNRKQAIKELKTAIAKDSRYIPARVALASLLVEEGAITDALSHANFVIAIDKKNTDAYVARSKVYIAQLDYPSAINDISTNILLDPGNPEHYILRGKYYQKFSQHGNAINDFTKAISLEKNADAYLLRAQSYEEIMNYEDAARDYATITALSAYNMRAQMLLDKANARIYELNRETNKPEVLITSHQPEEKVLPIAGNAKEIVLSGKIKEESPLEKFTVNGEELHYEKKGNDYEFIANVNVEFANQIEIVAVDAYNNETKVVYDIARMETHLPVVRIIAPYASDNNELYLESNDALVFIQGQVSDESKIKSIFIDGVTASYKVDELNPSFTATVNVQNKAKITIEATDIYGNVQSAEFELNRDGANLAEVNPMGKTWVVFIENSKYETFASLDGPIKDISLMRSALTEYAVHNIIHKKDMTKEELTRFFELELRDLVKKNQVKSLLVWYAGHGKFINNVGYWIPTDAKRDDEFTYYNINTLRSHLQGYTDVLIHTLIITDACESGPSFYMAMRSTDDIPTCSDWMKTRFKSSQVFSSAGYELAVDDSQFTRTFASALLNNPDACIPIESIVQKVTVAVTNSNQQKPIFGIIKGLDHQDGTFFFITKQE